MQTVKQNRKQGMQILKMAKNPKYKLFRSLFDFRDAMKNMRPGVKRGSMERKWKRLYNEVKFLDDNDWWVEGKRTEDEDCEFLRQERIDEIRLSAEQGREFGGNREKEY